VHAWPLVASSLGIAIAASGLALWLATGRGGRPPLVLSAIVFGIAVSGMHYTAMEGVMLFAHTAAMAGAPALSTDLPPIVVACVGLGVRGIFLLFLVPDHTRTTIQPDVSRAVRAADGVDGAAVATDGHNRQLGRGTFAPQDGAGAPPRRFARHLPIERDG